MPQTQIDITHIPFSRYGAYLSVTRNERDKELIIHHVGRRFGEGPTLSLTFGEEDGEEFSCSAEPEKITVETPKGRVILFISDDRTLVLESHGVNVVWRMLPAKGYGTEEGAGRFRMVSVDQRVYMNYLVEQGKGVMRGPFEACGDRLRDRKQYLWATCKDGELKMAVSLTGTEPDQIKEPLPGEEEVTAIRREWEDFLGKMPDDQIAETTTREFCQVTWYNLWSSFVRADDVYHSDTMLMSKKFMSSVWSWDHCFNALAMAKVGKEKAMEQFLAPFVLQSPKGALPDMWNPHTEVVWGVTKPPIHGWCFSKLMDCFPFTEEELIRVYGYLVKWTGWWMKENDSDHDGIPEYPQGCDSGWDNSTLFDLGFYVESPDLPAYLILQMETQARIAETLAEKQEKGRGEAGQTENGDVESRDWSAEGRKWRQEAKYLTERFYAHSWSDGRFVAKLSGSHEYEEQPTSLISLMPLVLGDCLDQEKRRKLVKILKQDFLTEHGLATEMPAGKKYEPDGYWRGPIWAPVTYLLVDGLRRGGEEALAAEIAGRYCQMSEQLARGNYENFDALTGKGLRAPGYTWSASVYMLLHWEYGN
ncbi:MAG: trehalase family glycosidase [Lachnospiraceae bacterium]|nr:trehalase family glycosidase [Lachnospiraceae bacterium]